MDLAEMSHDNLMGEKKQKYSNSVMMKFEMWSV